MQIRAMMAVSMMGTYEVVANIENRPDIGDPEGSTILEDLVNRDGATDISNIRCSKNLCFTVQSKSPEDAVKIVREVCDRMRIYNPITSILNVSVR